ncbi:hypothetical protein LCGC14_2235110 [marine sediment metagenome]|uniref:Uncharacterized protein n=1 Tax=marine sediment metagenome TaxID=412755 RepID=A0A0F9G243_9ZZZZ
MEPVTAQEWYELVERSEDRGSKKLSDEERNKYLFNSFQRGHLSLKFVLELLGLDSCDDCGKIMEPGEDHSKEDCTVWRVMES